MSALYTSFGRFEELYPVSQVFPAADTVAAVCLMLIGEFTDIAYYSKPASIVDLKEYLNRKAVQTAGSKGAARA